MIFVEWQMLGEYVALAALILACVFVCRLVRKQPAWLWLPIRGLSVLLGGISSLIFYFTQLQRRFSELFKAAVLS